MKNEYDLVLTAGSRIYGMPKFGSDAEKLHHEQHVIELKNELGSNVISYLSNMGIIVALLTEDEATKYMSDHRIFGVHKREPHKAHAMYSRETATNNQWHLKQLSNRLFSNSVILCGFKLGLIYTIYGHYPAEYSQVAHELIITSANNKVLHNGIVHTFEVDFQYKHIDVPYTVVSRVSSSSSHSIGLHYIGYNIASGIIEVRGNLIDNFVPIYTVEIVQYNDSVTTWYTGSPNTIGFYNIQWYKGNEDVYNATLLGSGVEIIVGDTQLNFTHEDFNGRASIAYNAYASRYTDVYGAWDTNNPDIDQHGTAVGLAAGGTISGLAPNATVTGVTCLDISESRGNQSDRVMFGFDFIVGYIADKKAAASLAGVPYPVVVNFSMGTSNGIVSAPEDYAIASMIAEGAIVCIAAGNDNEPHNSSPYDSEAILVGACSEDLIPSSFTNFGPHIDVYAPGQDIWSPLYGEFSRWQGTSVASPNVAGLCALFLELYPEATPKEAKDAIIDNAIIGITYNKDSTTFLFVQNPFKGFVNRYTMNTAKFLEDRVYTVIPYFIGFDTEKNYGCKLEMTVNSITSAVVSAGQTESIELATAIKLIK